MFKLDWFIFAVITLFLWGLWGLFSKLASNFINPKSILIFQALGSIIVYAIVLILINFKPELNPGGIVFSILAGLSVTLGVLFFLFSISKGKISIVVVITALYPLVTIILAFLFLKEPITIKQGIGILLALAAMLLFAI